MWLRTGRSNHRLVWRSFRSRGVLFWDFFKNCAKLIIDVTCFCKISHTYSNQKEDEPNAYE